MFLSLLFFYILHEIASSTSLEDKYHVVITTIPSRGRSNQLISIAEELITTATDDYFVTFVLHESSVRYLDDFKARYPLKENKRKYQIISTPDCAKVTDPLNTIESIKLYFSLLTTTFYNTYPVLHRYLEATDNYSMTTFIDDYSKYNLSSACDKDVIFKPIDVVLSDMLNTATFVLTKMYHIPTVAFQTIFEGTSESNWFLGDSALVASRRVFEDRPNSPASFSYLQHVQTRLFRFVAFTFMPWYIATFRYNPILSDEFNITHDMLPIHDLSEIYSESLILKPMGPPVTVKDTYKSERTQYSGFLVPKHLYQDKAWLDPVTLQLFAEFGYNELLEWMEDKPNIIYISFGTVIGSDSVTVNVLQYIANHVFREQFLAKHDLYVLWSIRKELQVQIFGDYSNERIRFQSWIPQRELLHHPHIRLSMNHGGTSSILESVFAGKPLFIAGIGHEERLGNAIILKESGCADYISDLDYVLIRKQILALTQNSAAQQKCKEVKKMMMFFGGTKHAVYVLKYAIEFGTKPLIPTIVPSDLLWYQKTNIDLYVIAVVWISLVAYGMNIFCVKCASRRVQSVQTQTHST